MDSILAYRYHSTETYDATKSFTDVLTGKHSNNPFLTAVMAQLTALQEELRQSIAYHDRESLAQESDEVDERFNEAFTDFRDYVEVTAQMSQLGALAEQADSIRAVISRHDRTLHNRPKSEQILLFDSIQQELPAEAVEGAGVAPLLAEATQAHEELKDIENRRREADTARKDVPAPYEICKKVNPLLTMTYTHLTDIVELLPQEYSDTLSALNSKVAPLVRRVKARRTRRENEEEDV